MYLKGFKRRAFFILIVLIIMLASGQKVYAEDPLITIVKAVWTDGVDNKRNPKQEYGESVSSSKHLYLWTRVKGGEEALNILESRGKLPIRHKWYTYIGTSPQFEESQKPIDAVNLSVGKKAKINELRLEVDNHGYFDWRTWSMKKNIRAGWWKVRIVYEDGEPVLCEDEPCEYVINVE